jgi:GntR family transcriptional regulator
MENPHFIRIKIDFRKKQPLADQLKEALLHQINTGEIQPGEQLPTVRLVAAQLGINFNTVARAYRMLDQSGYLTTQQGRGTFVTLPETQEEQPTVDIEKIIEGLIPLLDLQARKAGILPEELLSQIALRMIARQKKAVISFRPRRHSEGKKYPRRKHARNIMANDITEHSA